MANGTRIDSARVMASSLQRAGERPPLSSGGRALRHSIRKNHLRGRRLLERLVRPATPLKDNYPAPPQIGQGLARNQAAERLAAVAGQADATWHKANQVAPATPVHRHRP